MNRAARLVVFYPKTVIAAVLAVTAAFTAALVTRGVGFNGSPETLARKDSTLEFFNEVRSTFGDDRVIIVALTTTDVFTPEFIQRLDRLTSRLARITGVADARSLTNIQAVRRHGDEVSVDRLIPRSGASAEYLYELKQTVTRDPLYAKQIVSEDGRTAAISVFINASTESESRAVAKQVEAVSRAEAGQDELLLAGVPVMDARAIESMVRDMLVCSPIAALLCFVVFLAAFRSFWGAFLPMAALAIGLVWTFGLMSLTGSEITFATLPLPTVLLAIGSSYIFHVQNQCRISTAAAAPDQGRIHAWLAGLIFITPAVFISGTTTIAGFASLASSTVPTVRDMGIFEAAGVAAMLLLSLTFIPATLALLPAASLSKTGSQQRDYATWLNGSLRQITALILFRRRTVLLIFFVCTALVGAGALRMRVNTDYLSIFPESSDTVQSARRLHERLAGAASVQLVVGGARDAVLDPDFLNGVARLEEFSLEQPGVDSSISIAGIVKRFNRVLSTNTDGAEVLPSDRERLKSIFDDYLSQDDFVSRLVSSDQSRAIIVLRTNLFASNELKGLTDKIEIWSRANLPHGTSVRATGSFVLLNDASDAVAASQSSSLLIALITIYLMMAALFRSFATGFLALIPNLLPIACYFGFLGWTGITLDITTSLVAAAALGLAVDNAVHMIRRYRQSIAERAGREGDEEGQVMWLTILRTGKPMVLANLMLVAAYLIFVLSSFTPVRVAGLLWAVTIFVCLAADLIFLPALMKTRLFSAVSRGRAKELPGAGPSGYSDLKKVAD